MIHIDFITLSWLFAISITAHNLEEAIWLPKWSISAGRWHLPIEPAVFRFAVLILTLFAYILSILASIGGKLSIDDLYELSMEADKVFTFCCALFVPLKLGVMQQCQNVI